MKALFITTQTNDCLNHVLAWESAFGPCDHLTFDHRGIRNDWMFSEKAEQVKPEVIFYIGACKAPGNPQAQTLADLRDYCPTINLCSDAADRPWHPVLAGMRTQGCFDLQVSIDGAKEAPVDFVTLTPVDARPFVLSEDRDIRCGFSGTVGRWNARSEIVGALEMFGGLTVRRREEGDSYADHVRFMRRCRMILNLSHTGSGQAHHIKGRVLEAGWAGCCLLESEGSPIAEWFPEDCYLTFKDAKHAKALIEETPDDLVNAIAARLAAEVQERFRAETIYGGMLSRVGLLQELAA